MPWNLLSSALNLPIKKKKFNWKCSQNLACSFPNKTEKSKIIKPSTKLFRSCSKTAPRPPWKRNCSEITFQLHGNGSDCSETEIALKLKAKEPPTNSSETALKSSRNRNCSKTTLKLEVLELLRNRSETALKPSRS